MKSPSLIQPWMFIALAMPLLLLVSCSRYAKEKEFVQAVGAEKLTTYAAELQQKDAWKTVKGQLPKEMWHEAFASHGVLQVKQYFTGLQIVLETRDRNERGVYIATDKSSPPEDGSGIHFEKLADGVYWFEQKNRVQYIPPEKRNAASK